MVNMQMAFLSPPFGYSLFYLKSVAPPQNHDGDDSFARPFLS
jgi:TRAP-type mannitol/chloroaromatic compound transport system permease large subunit